MSKKVKQDQSDAPKDDGVTVVLPEPVNSTPVPASETAHNTAVQATEPVNNTPDPAQEGNGQQKEKEPKDVRFQRLAVKRVNKALKVLSHVGNLANRATYSYTDEQAVKVVNALVNAVKTVADKFAGNPSKGGGWTL